MKIHKMIRAAALLLIVCLCMNQASAAGIVREQDFEVPPDYSNEISLNKGYNITKQVQDLPEEVRE